MKDDYDLSSLLTNKKKRKKSKPKGNAFENKIATLLNERFNTTDFCRSPGSGAFATTHKLPEHLKIYGDLITPKDFKFIIECKKGYNKEGLGSLFKKNSIVYGFIEQAARDAEKSGKKFILILCQDRQPSLAIMESNSFGAFNKNSLNYFNIFYSKEMNKEYCIVLLEELLNVMPVSYFFN